MLSEPGTFDHYLGKGQFPEYSVLSKNLVPCCSKCNSKKGEKFLSANGNRIFISFYFDKLPKSSFLVVELGVDGDVPYIKNMYTRSNMGNSIDEIIETHFDELELFERYKNPIRKIYPLILGMPIEDIIIDLSCTDKCLIEGGKRDLSFGYLVDLTEETRNPNSENEYAQLIRKNVPALK
ncbi:MAG: hypothetical protein ACI4SE_03160 [Lachnospiraceae bacterium]